MPSWYLRLVLTDLISIDGKELMVKQILQQLSPVSPPGGNAGDALGSVLETNSGSAVILGFIKPSNVGIVSSLSFAFVNKSL